MPNVDAGGCRLSYTVDGPADAPALLMVNSLGTTGDMWAAQLPELVKRRRVIRYDARGHGRSDVPTGDYTLDRLGRDALAVLDAAGAVRADICGISLGGMTAMWLGINAPERVGRLILSSTGAKIGTLDGWNVRMQAVIDEGMESIADASMGRWFTAAFHEREPTTVAHYREMVAACPQAGYLGCSAAIRDADLRSDLGRIGAPSLVIVGLQDPATPPSDGELIRRGIEGAQLIAFDAAHLCNIECAIAFNGAITPFLDS
jgi:3-oxoadipate enol-lactonase